MPPVYSESEASPKGRAVTGGNQSQRLTKKGIQKSIMSDNEIYNNKTRLRNIHKGKNKYLCSL